MCRGAFGVADRSELRFQRRSSAFVYKGGVGSTIEERSNIPRVADIGGVHKGSPAGLIPRIHIGSVFEQQRDEARIFRDGRIPKSCPTAIVPSIGIGSPIQQQLGILKRAANHRARQGRPNFVVRVDVSARVQ